MARQLRRTRRGPAIGLALLATAGGLSARQFNNQWYSVTESPGSIAVAPTAISDNNNETDLAWGDLDKDGDIDLVVVRKQPFTSVGKRTNILLMNEGGVLVDSTSTLAVASDVPGDNGFLTATNDRDVVLSDVDGDGWLDVITATTLSDGDPKHIGHPRIYMNLGGSPWQGLRNEDARVPQLIHFGTLAPENPRFCAVAAGDVTGDGAPDLYFGDYDSSGAGGVGQPGNKDLNDRLLINDGNGFFTDQSQLRMSSTMLKSAFAMAVEIEDINLDGTNDIIKDTALMSPQYVAASYNDPNNVGFFYVFDSFHTNAPYHIDIGDLNNDNRPDIVVTDDFADRYRLNTGVDIFGRVIWSSSKTFEFLSGGDDGFGGNNLIVDLDGDGWRDVLICDVDVDVGGYNRRLHIYHNLGTTPGSTNFSLREERQSSGSGWIGVVGLDSSDMTGTHDVAVFDIDNNGSLDIIISRHTGTRVFLGPNGTEPPNPHCASYGPETGTNVGILATQDAMLSGTKVTFELSGFGGAGTAFMVFSGSQDSTPLLGGTKLVNTPFVLTQYFSISEDGSGSFCMTVPLGVEGFTVYGQVAMMDGTPPSGWAFSNGLCCTVY